MRLSEKYLRQISACVSAISISEWVNVFDTDAYETLVQSVKRINHGHLTEQDASFVLTDVIVGFALDRLRDSGRVGQLSEDRNSDFRDALFDSLRDAIESLPWEMQINFPLEKFTGLGALNVRLSESIVLRANSVDAGQSGPPRNALLALVEGRQHAWLCVSVKGYGAGNAETGAISNAITQAKQCLYFFRKFCVPYSRDAGRPLLDAYAVLPTDQCVVQLPHTLSRHFGALKPVDELLQFYDTSGAKTLLGGRWRPASNPEERLSAMSQQLQVAQDFFQRRTHDDFGAIGAAIEWYIDSVTADNQTFAYIAACIGLEALLGDGDSNERMDAMSSRLSDRYGFLLGAGRTQREKLAEDYREMLALRGKLVHARSKRLSADEQTKLSQVQRMLSNVIDKEVSVFVRG